MASWPGDAALSKPEIRGGEGILWASPAGRGKLTPLVLGHLGRRSPSTVVGRLIYSLVNIRERNSDTFPIKNNQMHFWALRGVVKTLLSTIMCEAEKYCRVPTGRVRILLYFVLFCCCCCFLSESSLGCSCPDSLLLAGGQVAGVRVGLGASCFSGRAGRFKILLWPGLVSSWAGQGWGREGRQSTPHRMNQL